MADLFNLSNLGVDDSGFGGSSLKTGDIRRKYNFGDRVSELSLSQDPFFRFLSMASKAPTDDPSFKFTERRGSWHKRYGYVIGHGSGFNVTDASVFSGAPTKGDEVILFMGTDYKSAGNIQNVFNNSNSAFAIGDAGTEPIFYLEDQIIKVPLSSTAGGGAAGAAADYFTARVKSVATGQSKSGVATHSLTTGASDATVSLDYVAVKLTCEVIRVPDGTSYELSSFVGNEPVKNVYGASISETLEPARSYVIGTAHEEGSGYPETWKDQPFSNGYGQTQIWKTGMAMTNTARATSLKYDASEWARVWKEKLVEHKWDIEQSLLFGSQVSSSSRNYTQGAVDYILQNGNVFELDVAKKTQDDFLDDMSKYIDPRYNNSTATVFFCDTATYNWLHKLSGYFANNIGSVQPFSGGAIQNTPGNISGTSNMGKNVGSAEVSMTGKKKVFVIDITTISTIYGDMNVARNIHLDGTNIKMLGINMKYCKYRPLVGNGINRDTSVYVGVQTLENSGIDRRVDLILTEAGMQWEMPECHAVWKA